MSWCLLAGNLHVFWGMGQPEADSFWLEGEGHLASSGISIVCSLSSLLGLMDWPAKENFADSPVLFCNTVPHLSFLLGSTD